MAKFTRFLFNVTIITLGFRLATGPLVAGDHIGKLGFY